MAATLFKEVAYSLSKLIEDIEMGEIGLPEIQRPFVWKSTKVRDLFDSMYRGFPVGYLLFWQSMASGNRQIGSGEKQKTARLLIVDGQQRLTSLYTVLKSMPVLRQDFKTERIRIAFRPRDQVFEVLDAAILKDPEFMPDVSTLWSKDVGRKKTVAAFLKRLRDKREVSEEEEEMLEEAIDRVLDLQHYPFTALELSGTVGEEEVADVFVRINSKGMTLNQADFILTLMSVYWDEGRSDLEAFCRAARTPSVGAPSPFNYYIQPDPDHLLRVSVALGFRRARLQHVYSILRGKDLETGEFSDERREEQFGVLCQAQASVLDVQNWHEFLKAIMTAGYRSGGMISSQIGLLYAYALYLIGLRDFHVDRHQLRQVIARWFFMTALTGHYSSGAPETIMDQDLNRLSDATNADEFVAVLNHAIDDKFTEDFWSINLANELATSASRGPTLFAYYAALNLLGAKVLFSKMTVHELLDPTTKANKSALERHHLFPKGYLQTLGVTHTRDTNQIANFALVEWSDNIGISDAPPSEYFPAYAARFNEADLRQMRAWHALPDGWTDMEYWDFIDARRRLIAKVIREGHECLVSKATARHKVDDHATEVTLTP